jgi:hypothetical protein
MRALWLLPLLGCASSSIDSDERARVLAVRAQWIDAARAERCPRPALREPVTGDGTALLAGLLDPASPEGRCLAGVREKLDPLACAPLYDKIDRIAHATAACSPMTLDEDYTRDGAFIIALADAIEVRIAPLVGRGELASAARHVIDAMRFADDYGRKGTVIGLMVGASMSSQLADTLAELLVDPRLTPGDARAIARDLDILLASGPDFAATMRQEDAWLAKHVDKMSGVEDIAAELLAVEQRAREVRRACSDTLRRCVEQLDVGAAAGGELWREYARKLGARDFALTFVRMQAELRIAGPDDCNAPPRRRALLAGWRDHAVLGDAFAVSPPAWHQSTATRVPRCVPATL